MTEPNPIVAHDRWTKFDFLRFAAPYFALGLGIGAVIDLVLRIIYP